MEPLIIIPQFNKSNNTMVSLSTTTSCRFLPISIVSLLLLLLLWLAHERMENIESTKIQNSFVDENDMVRRRRANNYGGNADKVSEDPTISGVYSSASVSASANAIGEDSYKSSNSKGQTKYPTTSNPTHEPTPMPSKSRYSKPHILFILVDDLAYGNIGFTYNSDSEDDPDLVPSYLSFNTTLTMTRLAREEGRVMTRHYTAPVCTPTRSAFQSGRLPIHVTQALTNPCQPSSGMPSKMTGIAEIMQKGGYYTAMVGKWDAGMATREQTPIGRGYNDSLVYFAHGNWMWTYKFINKDSDEIKDVINSIPTCDIPGVNGCVVDLWENDGPARSIVAKKQYEEEVFAQRVMSIINKVATMKEKKPLFLVYAPRVGHYPLEAPIEYQNRIREIVKQNAKYPSETQDADLMPHRLVYSAMLLYLDDKINQIVDLLKKNKMWDNTLLVLTSDNGGFINLVSSCLSKSNGELVCPNGVAGATNYPLRGGKGSFYEGGIRVPTFISGGLIPKNTRGKPIDQMFHIADWYATFAYAAGVTDITDAKAKTYGLPPIDSINMWNALFPDEYKGKSGDFPEPRSVIPLGPTGIIYDRYKLLLGNQIGAAWTPRIYPTRAQQGEDLLARTTRCGTGCLFDVVSDKYERNNLAPLRTNVVYQLSQMLLQHRKTFWGRASTPISRTCLDQAKRVGYLSPFLAE